MGQTAVQRIFASKGLNAQQTAFAIKKQKSHRCVELATEVIQFMEAQMALTEVPKHFQSPPACPGSQISSVQELVSNSENAKSL